MDEFKPFSPSIDWSNGLVDSLIWIGEAWAITALGTLVVLILIARFTIWGRQFWAVTGAYFTGRHSMRPWVSLGRHAVVGDRRGAAERVVQLPEQRPVLRRVDRGARSPCR